jgi:signal transduction histidine kinase
MRSVNSHASVMGTAGPHLLFWLGWAALLPAVVRVNDRAARLAGGVVVRAGAFLIAAFGFALCDIALMFAVRAAITFAFGGEQVALWSLVRGWLLLGVVSYAVLATGWLALEQWHVARARELAAARLAEQLARARLGSLQAQLQPHFLFNTMNAIAMLCRLGDAERAVEMLAGVSELLRDLLDDHDTHEVPLRDELRVLSRYVEIEEVRFGDRLRVELDVPVDLHDLLVPRLILQPLVENAIRHGITPRAGNGRVNVIARREGTRLSIRVEDDGIGLAASPGTGIGLGNTRARLGQLYRDAATLRIARAANGGTVVAVEVPCHSAPWPIDAHAPSAVESFA